jgi:hypothetical protein
LQQTISAAEKKQGSTKTFDDRSLNLMALVVAPAIIFSLLVYNLPLAQYLQDINVDDSFYYYSVARNFSDGHFSTYDGVGLTNGYHPLWAWLLVPVFAIFKDPVTALRVAKMEELGLLLVAVCFAMSAGRAAGWRFSTMCIIPVWLFSRVIFFIGLEVAAQVFLLAVLMYLLTRLFENPTNRSSWTSIAIVCALLPWVRLECIAVSVTTSTLITVYTLKRSGQIHGRLLAIWGATLGGAAIYFVYNRYTFGTYVPVSGQIKAFWSAMQFSQSGGFNLFVNALTFLRHEPRLHAATLICVLIVAMSWLIPAYRYRTRDANHGIDCFVLALAASHVARTIFSTVSLNILYDVQWYYVPGLLLLALTVPLAISRGFFLSDLLIKMPEIRWRRLEAWVGTAALLLTLLILKPHATITKWHGFRNTWAATSFEGVQWMNENLPDGTVVGSTDSGVIGYFSRHRVINLDGLVNSAEFLAAVKSQSVESWIRASGINYFANAMWTDTDGCRFMANASGQVAAYAGPCTLVHDGTAAWTDTWNGKESEMRFRVFRYGNQTSMKPYRASGVFRKESVPRAS